MITVLRHGALVESGDSTNEILVEILIRRNATPHGQGSSALSSELNKFSQPLLMPYHIIIKYLHMILFIKTVPGRVFQL
jgi:hypothetical protein